MKTLTALCTAALLMILCFPAFPQEKEKYPLSEVQSLKIQNKVQALMLAQDKVAAAQAEFNAVNADLLDEMHATEKANKWPDNLLLNTQLLPKTIQLVDPPAPPAAAKPEPKKDEKPAPAPAPPAPAPKAEAKKP
jgi:outer membrane biosynthesis protein TonB